MAAAAKHVEFSEKDLPKDVWLLRPCELYKEEYSDCKSFSGRFQQYYVYGENQDCQKWKEDYENCLEFRRTLSRGAAEKVLEHERVRREARLQGARGNDVWEYRRRPPRDWHTPLANEKDDKSVLAKVQEVHKTRGTLSKSEQQTSCVVS